MATLVLSTVGTMLGGPVGGVIGSLLGQSIDQQLFGPGPRDGPRLGDLAVQTSSYGTPVPRLFGTMRVAGSIIWSTDLQESSETQGAKGQPDTVTYSYSVSFAVALSSRPILGIGRIWADGKLIRTAEGQFTVNAGFRIHDGSEGQQVDPLIESIEGAGSAPAYRGLALAVFEHLQLADFGNRIPFLSFEVEADEAAVTLGHLLDDVSKGVIASSSTNAVVGYAAHGATIADSIAPLVDVYAVSLFDNGKVLASADSETEMFAEEELGCTPGSEVESRIERARAPAQTLPAQLSLGYYDVAREYQSGFARAALDERVARDEKILLPAVLPATEAKALAETSLARRWAESELVKLRLPPRAIALRAGALVRFPNSGEPWRIERVIVDGMAVSIDVRPVYATIASVAADPGRVLPSLGVEPAPTTVEVVEMPDDGTGTADSPVVAIAASSNGTSWKAVPVEVEVAGTALAPVTAGSRAIIGTAITALGTGQAAAFDMLNTVDVELVDPKQWLESRDDVVVSELSNLALVGKELVQFGDATPIGPGRFRLSRLLRGRRGSEWAMGLHDVGERFVIIDPARLIRLPTSSAHVGSSLRATPRGLADSAASASETIVAGEALRPPSPVHLRAWIDADGTLHCTWVRRSCRGWAWLDGVDAPLGATSESYRVSFRSAADAIEIATTEPQAAVGAADLAELGVGPFEVSVMQVGDLAVSRPASIKVNAS
jgi:hypothetical protein